MEGINSYLKEEQQAKLGNNKPKKSIKDINPVTPRIEHVIAGSNADLLSK